MSLLVHPRLVPCLGACSSDDDFFIVTPLYSGGSLYDLLYPELLDSNLDMNQIRDITATKNGVPSWQALLVALDVAEGMQFLHSRHTLHRDIKSANVLLDSNGRAYLADFGIARLENPTQRAMTRAAGTPRFTPAEVLGVEIDDMRMMRDEMRELMR